MMPVADRPGARGRGAGPAGQVGPRSWSQRTSWLGVAPPRQSPPHRGSRSSVLRIGAHIFSWHQAGVVAKHLEPATEVMRADAGLHADPTRRQIGESGLHLATRPLLPQHDGTVAILSHDVKRALANIDADHGDCAVVGLLRHGVLLVFAAPSHLLSLAGREHGRTIPLADIPALSVACGRRHSVSSSSSNL